MGNPYGFTHAHRFLTRSALFFYMRYAYVAEHVNFTVVDTVVELGSGAGKQAEVLKRLHPHLTIVLLDTAPSLYVAERFLTAAYPGETVPYRETREPGCALVPGQIHFFGQLPRGRHRADRQHALLERGHARGDGPGRSRALRAGDHPVGRVVVPARLLRRGPPRRPRRRSFPVGPTPLAAYVDAFPEHELVDRRVAHTGLAELVDRTGTYDDTFWARRWI